MNVSCSADMGDEMEEVVVEEVGFRSVDVFCCADMQDDDEQAEDWTEEDQQTAENVVQNLLRAFNFYNDPDDQDFVVSFLQHVYSHRNIKNHVHAFEHLLFLDFQLVKIAERMQVKAIETKPEAHALVDFLFGTEEILQRAI